MYKLIVFVLSFLLHGCFLNLDNQVTLSKVSNLSDLDSAPESSESISVEFDFETEMITENSFAFSVKTEFESKPTVSFDGNISLSILSYDTDGFHMNAVLPEVDGETSIQFSYGNRSANRSIYSLCDANGNYAISSISSYSARRILGLLSNQDLMDNDKISAEEQVSTDEGIMPATLESSRIYGTLHWEDDNGLSHPLYGVKVKATFKDSIFNFSTYTTTTGHFQLDFFSLSLSEDYECTIHIYTENAQIRVTDDKDNLYEYVKTVTIRSGMSRYFGNLTFAPNDNTGIGKAAQIFAASKSYADYAQSLVGDDAIEQCTVMFPTDDANCSYRRKTNTIYLAEESTKIAGYPEVYASWDTIGHEYGHHLQHHYFPQSYSGEHYIGQNCLYTLIDASYSGATSLSFIEAKELKEKAIGIAFKEGWATFFSIMAQSMFEDDEIDTVGDSIYTAFNGVNQSLLDLVNKKGTGQMNGESDEIIVMDFLYRVWDSANTISQDRITISDAELWQLMVENNPASLSDFVSDLYHSDISFSRSDLGILLEAFELSASGLSLKLNSDNYRNVPEFKWNRNGTEVIYNGVNFGFGNTGFRLNFYDANMNLIFCTAIIGDTNYKLSQGQWNQILLASGTGYYVIIESYAVHAYETGPYYSRTYQFSKPSKATESIALKHLKYYEKKYIIAPGTEWVFNLSFDSGGTKLIQTFGTSDTKLSLYDTDGITLLCSDDDSGYKRNAFMAIDLEENHDYILKLKLYNQRISGEARLSIAPFGGFYNPDSESHTFDDLFYLETKASTSQYTFKGYLSEKNSMMVTWKPEQTGSYKIYLESGFQNCLYIIDPSSTKEYIYNNGYSYGTSATIEGTYSSESIYFIIAAQYDFSQSLEEYGKSLDLVFRKA